MSTMNISLPESLKSFVDKKVKGGRYGTSSEYVRELIRRDQSREQVRRMVLEGLESPNLGEVDSAYWASKRRRLQNAK